MKIKRTLNKYQLGILAILQGGGKIVSERGSGIIESFLFDCNEEYCGMVELRSIKALNKRGLLTCEEPNEDLTIFYAAELINE